MYGERLGQTWSYVGSVGEGEEEQRKRGSERKIASERVSLWKEWLGQREGERFGQSKSG